MLCPALLFALVSASFCYLSGFSLKCTHIYNIAVVCLCCLDLGTELQSSIESTACRKRALEYAASQTVFGRPPPFKKCFLPCGSRCSRNPVPGIDYSSVLCIDLPLKIVQKLRLIHKAVVGQSGLVCPSRPPGQHLVFCSILTFRFQTRCLDSAKNSC